MTPAPPGGRGPGPDAHGVARRLAPLLPLAAAAVLAALAVSSLPPLPFAAPGTPYDRSIPAASADFALLSSAAKVIPAAASVAAATLPRDPSADIHLFRTSVALLPGRDLVPLAAAEAGTSVDYLVVAGELPALPAWDLVLETPRGSVWRRRH
ncbi:MAG: hypothetical protein M3167_17925 [Acidobacteriota bacterium]|nr:hypothetical protein [Acidobacteriota bacterium]